MATKKLARVRSVYRCDACGHVESKWLGRCPACQQWNSLIEQVDMPAARTAGAADGSAPIAVTDVVELGPRDRLASGIGEYDRVLGGDRKSTRLNSSHMSISYAVFCLKKKKVQL